MGGGPCESIEYPRARDKFNTGLEPAWTLPRRPCHANRQAPRGSRLGMFRTVSSILITTRSAIFPLTFYESVSTWFFCGCPSFFKKFLHFIGRDRVVLVGIDCGPISNAVVTFSGRRLAGTVIALGGRMSRALYCSSTLAGFIGTCCRRRCRGMSRRFLCGGRGTRLRFSRHLIVGGVSDTVQR